MAITVTTQKILDSTRNVILKFIITGTSDAGSATLYDPNSYIDIDKNVKVMKIKYELQGFSAYLLFDDNKMISLASNNPSEINFEDMGGILYNNSPQTGKISIKTNGLAAGDIGTIILILKKVSSHVLITSPDVWFDASNANFITLSGSDVVQINDCRENTYTASQSVASRRPDYQIGVINNKNAIFFVKATKDWLLTNYFWPLQFTLFFVYKPTTITGQGLANNFDGTGGAENGQFILDFANAVAQKYRVWYQGGNFNSSSTYGTTGDVRIITLTCNSSKLIKLYVNQVFQGSGTHTSTLLYSLPIALFGNQSGANIGGSYDGYFCEMMMFNTLISQSEITNVENDLRIKWGN